MLRALRTLENPKHKESYVLTAKGYFGDGDENFTVEESSGGYIVDAKTQSVEDKEDWIEAAFKAYKYFQDNWVECRSDLPEEYQDYIQGASWDYEFLPSKIEELTLYYYDNLGNPHDVEVIE